MQPSTRRWFKENAGMNIKDDYHFEKKLGTGGYGSVYLARNKKTGNLFNLKI